MSASNKIYIVRKANEKSGINFGSRRGEAFGQIQCLIRKGFDCVLVTMFETANGSKKCETEFKANKE